MLNDRPQGSRGWSRAGSSLTSSSDFSHGTGLGVTGWVLRWIIRHFRCPFLPRPPRVYLPLSILGHSHTLRWAQMPFWGLQSGESQVGSGP